MSDLTWTADSATLGELVPWERNPKAISKRNAERLLDYWQRIGQFQTVAIGPGGEVYDGHQRLSVLKAAFGPSYRIDVRRASRALSEAERQELVIAAHAGTTGQWDWDALASWDAGELRGWGFDAELLHEWNDDAANLALMLEADKEQPVADVEPQLDRAEELREKWGVQPGQLWRLGAHRIICGDCTDPEVVARVLQGETPLLMVTDPPYGVEYDANWRNEAAEKGLISYADRRVGKVANDDRAEWSEAWRLFPGDVAYMWSPGGDHVIITGQALQEAGFKIRAMLMWKKAHIPIGRGHYCYQHEPVWYAVKKGRMAHWIGGHMSSSVWEITLDKNVEGGHSTQKPLECMERPIRNHEGDVYEPFCGSGTTIIAAERQGRRCFAVEIEPKYVAVTLQRWADATGGTPELCDK